MKDKKWLTRCCDADIEVGHPPGVHVSGQTESPPDSVEWCDSYGKLLNLEDCYIVGAEEDE